MDKMYVIECEDGFSVMSHDRDEVVQHGLKHIREMHPHMKMTKQEMEMDVKAM